MSTHGLVRVNASIEYMFIPSFLSFRDHFIQPLLIACLV